MNICRAERNRMWPNMSLNDQGLDKMSCFPTPEIQAGTLSILSALEADVDREGKKRSMEVNIVNANDLAGGQISACMRFNNRFASDIESSGPKNPCAISDRPCRPSVLFRPIIF